MRQAYEVICIILFVVNINRMSCIYATPAPELRTKFLCFLNLQSPPSFLSAFKQRKSKLYDCNDEKQSHNQRKKL